MQCSGPQVQIWTGDMGEGRVKAVYRIDSVVSGLGYRAPVKSVFLWLMHLWATLPHELEASWCIASHPSQQSHNQTWIRAEETQNPFLCCVPMDQYVICRGEPTDS